MGITKMKKSCWKKAYNSNNRENSPIFTNPKKGLWVQRSGKQLGSHDNFHTEKFPVHVQGTSGREIETKWFSDKKTANKYMKRYMKENC